MNQVHAHEILRMMEGNNYPTKAILKESIIQKFGENQLFHTCSAKGLDADAIIEFLEKKGKFKCSDDMSSFTMDINKVCDSY